VEPEYPSFDVKTLGACTIPSPLVGPDFVEDGERVLYHSRLEEVRAYLLVDKRPPCFEVAGPREMLFHDPKRIACGIVTCGGICPGLNDVIRAVVQSLHYHYGVERIYGFRYGYAGITKTPPLPPLELTPSLVRDIHEQGGTILGTSRGPQDPAEMVDVLEGLGVGILFALGGDGTLRGAQKIAEEAERRGMAISVIGIPKTIDNDISYVQKTFGFETAVTESQDALYSAHTEATGTQNGIGLVKLMGRHSGFIAAFATLASNDVNFCLVPEVPFTLEGFLRALRARLERRGHAVVVVAEGAGQDILENTAARDASGNPILADIGHYLRDEIKAGMKREGIDVNLKYIDPSYTIRSIPANPHDSAFCLLLGHDAVHAGMAGRTNMVVSFWRNEFVHVPIPMAVSRRKQIDPNGKLWSSVLAATGQPPEMR
jgi:6-phosphofructokinase 1